MKPNYDLRALKSALRDEPRSLSDMDDFTTACNDLEAVNCYPVDTAKLRGLTMANDNARELSEARRIARRTTLAIFLLTGACFFGGFIWSLLH